MPMPFDLPAPLDYGPALKRFRRLRGWKQDRLARMLGVGQPMISRWESGRFQPDEGHRAAIESLFAAHIAPTPRALKDLVERSSLPVHLICDATHRLLACSPARKAEWHRDAGELMGQSLWRNACPEIVAEEARLAERGWHDIQDGRIAFAMGHHVGPDLVMLAGWLIWDRLVLADGSALRLVTTMDASPA